MPQATAGLTDGVISCFGSCVSKAAKLYSYYTMIQDDREIVASRADDKYLAVGIELNF